MSDPDDRLHPGEGRDPAQPPLPLGAAPGASAETTEGSPPFVMQCLSIAEWRPFIAGYTFPWRLPKTVVLHHTYRPDQHTWRGFTSMRAMQRFYAGKGWTSSPHIYCAADGIWLAAPLARIGIHAGKNNGSVRAGWYSIGLEMVWNGDVSRPDGATWDNTRAVLAGLSARLGRPLADILAFHRDSSPKSCPGNRVTRAWVLAEATPAPPVLPPAARGAPILGPASGTQAAAIAWLRRHATQYNAVDIRTIVTAYARIGDAAGVDWFLALAQCAHETGSLTSWWCAPPRRNPAGIGVTGHSVAGPEDVPPGLAWAWRDGRWHEGVSFAEWDDDAVRAHLGRLCGYALAPGAGTAEQRALVEYALTVRPLSSTVQGRHPTIDTFGGVWAVPGVGYGGRIEALAARMRGAS